MLDPYLTGITSTQNPLVLLENSQKFIFPEESCFLSKSTSESVLKSLPNSPRGFHRIEEVEDQDSPALLSESPVFNFPTIPILGSYNTYLNPHHN